MTVAVLSALRGPREAAVVTALEGAAGRVSVTRRCADLAELLAAADAGLGRVAVLSPDLPMLDREALVRLRSCGVRTVALADGDPRVAERMTALGVDSVVRADAPPADLVGVVLALADADHHGPAPGIAGPTPPAVVADGLGATRSLTEGDDVPVRGRVVAVWGPTGGPGRTTVAVNLAAELAALTQAPAGAGAGAGPGAGTSDAATASRGALLVDADTYGGTVAQVVGLLDEAPGIAAAARAAGQGVLDPHALARLTPVIADGLRVLTGISRADRWPELPGSSLDVVWEAARGLAAWVVVDCGFCLEQDEVLSYDTHAPRRNAATLSALAAADVVVVVGSGDPVGVQRLVRGLAELAECGATRAEPVVVVNRVRASAAGPRPERAVADALERYAGVTRPHVLPDDRAGVDAAVLRGGTLAEAAPQSPVRTALARLAAELAGVPHRSAVARRWGSPRSAVRS